MSEQEVIRDMDQHVTCNLGGLSQAEFGGG